MRQDGLVLLDPVRPGGGLVDDEATADGVVDGGIQRGAVGSEGGEAHSVGVQRKLLAAVHDQVGVLDELDLPGTAQNEPTTGPDVGDAVVGVGGVAQLGL
ncbi:hypothetical protein GCM10018954_057790 [Kutzneria kofuensis]